ncbi:MAG TPA: EscU/YscU/HrcU family type III secretion system export apparatus switch protein [Egibacteraceae bacterium]|nr:EscU/YscU/HrcU family type III secretion system export apparatus switch protein [Egibacteraceae bacterium]
MSAAQKTEDPTPKRRKESRQKGQIARTPELTAWGGLLTATFIMKSTVGAGARTTDWMANRLREVISEPDVATAVGFLAETTWRYLLVAAPLLVGLMVIGVVGSFLQTGFVPSTKLLKPKWERINPVKGAKRIFGPMAAWEGAKSGLKALAIALATLPPLQATVESLTGTQLAVGAVASVVGAGMITIMRNAALAGLAIAAADYALQRRKTNKSMKMTKQEVRDEHKQTEGDPLLKGALRERQMRLSRNRMMADVARADAVVVNPTHIAVALQYDVAKGAPRVVAKGSGHVATRIRERAAEHGVPVVRDVPLARTLHRSCKIGDEVPLALYEAVARLLAFVYALKARNLHSGGVHELVGT